MVGRPVRTRWTKREDAILLEGWGVVSIPVLLKRLPGRTTSGVLYRARFLGFGASRRGTVTVKALCTRTGWSRERIKTAAKRAGVQLRRLPAVLASPGSKARPFALDEDDADLIVEQLTRDHDSGRLYAGRAGEWGVPRKSGGMVPPACGICLRRDRPRYAKDECVVCYDAFRKAAKKKPDVRTWQNPKEWGGTRPLACRTCSRNDRPHYAKNQCRSCWDREWRRARKAEQETQVDTSAPPAEFRRSQAENPNRADC